MNVMVMDVEGTDGRERGEDQVRCCGNATRLGNQTTRRTLNANPHSSLSHHRKSSL